MTNTINGAATLADLRRAKDMTQAELAGKLAITQAAVAAWELGLSSPAVRRIRALASALDVTTDVLLDALEQTKRISQ